MFLAGVLLLLSVSSVLAVGSAVDVDTFIVNGQETDIRKHPYLVSIRLKPCQTCAFEHYCGGTIFNEDVIITGANCVRNAEAHDLLIVAGSSFRTGSLNDGGMTFPVDKIILHQDSTIDLAILRLSLKLPFDRSLAIQPVTIATTVPTAGKMAVVIGWGMTAESGDYSERLREVRVPIMDHDTCKELYELNPITEHEICAGFEHGGADACRGDAGGPLLVDGKMVGVSSWGIGCARPNSPGVYTNVIQLNEWIVSQALGIHVAFL